MKKKIIFLTIESVKRELDSKTLLALKALKRNYRVIIGQKGALREFIKDTNPGIMILKSFGPKNTAHIDFIKKNNFKIVSSDEELITSVDFEDKVEYRLNNENLSKLDVYLAIGETSDYPILKKKFNSIIKNILVCGNIRLELLKKDYRKLLEKDSNVHKNEFGKYILFLTGFAHINKFRANSEIDFIYSRIVNENIDPDSHHIYLINEQVKMQREILLQSLKFLNNFEKNFPGKNLVISPHPNEKFEFWENYINKKKFKNIFINKDIHSSSYSLINSSEMLISCNSTSLLEAFFLEKKVINLLGKKRRVSEIELLKKITNVVRSSDELTETIKDLEQTENKKILHQEVREIKNFEENFDSFKEILDKLDELENVDSYDSLFKNNYYFVISQFRKYKNYIKWIISSIINKNAQHHRFHKSKIGSRLKKFFFINNTKHINSLEKIENLKIKQIAHEVFLLDSLNKY
jgi:surface carbohydrate biosynthesis protein